MKAKTYFSNDFQPIYQLNRNTVFKIISIRVNSFIKSKLASFKINLN